MTGSGSRVPPWRATLTLAPPGSGPVLDLRSGELKGQHGRQRLHDKPFEALVLLLEHPGEVVTRDELRASLAASGRPAGGGHPDGGAPQRRPEQAENLKRQLASAAKMEVKRIGLRVREQAIRRVMDEARARLEQLQRAPEYAGILTGWIAEAAVGLGLPEAAVNASAAELHSDIRNFRAFVPLGLHKAES